MHSSSGKQSRRLDWFILRTHKICCRSNQFSIHEASHKTRIIKVMSDKQQQQLQQKPITALQDLLAGGLAGSASVCVGHPFDTHKVMLQTTSSNTTGASSSSMNANIQMNKLSILKLYRGMGAPLSTAAVVNALIFSSFGESSRLWDDYFFSDEGRHSINNEKDVPNHAHEHALNETPDHASWQKSFVCGSFAGAIQALVICPSEHVKCRLQIQNSSDNSQYKYKYKYGSKKSPTLKHAHNTHGNAHNHKQTFRGPFDALHKIVNGHGIRGLYRGFAVTAWREVPAFGLYFAAYDCIKESVSDLLCSRWNWDTASDSNAHLWAASSLGGGFSGALTWALIYPFDVVKTRIQTAPLETPIEKRRIVYMFRKVLDEHGWRFFFRGLGVTLLRAFPVNAIIFPVYEITLEHLSDNSIGS